jgi:hypothetical protein
MQQPLLGNGPANNDRCKVMVATDTRINGRAVGGSVLCAVRAEATSAAIRREYWDGSEKSRRLV